MEVKVLYERALSAVVNDQITVSKDSCGTFSQVSNELALIFEALDSTVGAICVDKAVLFYDAVRDIFTISSGCMCEIFKGYIFQSIVFSSSEIELFSNICNRSLDSDGQFILSDCSNSFCVDYKTRKVIDKISGNMKFGAVNLSLSGVVDDMGIREYYSETTGSIDAAMFIDSAFQALSIPCFLPPEVQMELRNPKVVFEENSNDPGIAPNDSFAVTFETDCAFGIDDLFHIKSLVFCFEKFGCSYALSITGKVKLLSLPQLDFFAGYDGEGSYTFAVKSDDNTSFGFKAIEELTKVDVSSSFPEELSAQGGLILSELIVQTDFKKIQSFFIEIAYKDTWTFCKNPRLALSDIKLGVIIADSIRNYKITGMITLFGKDVYISASYSDTEGCVFSGVLSPYGRISLREVGNGLARLFGAGDFTIPLDVGVTGLSMNADLFGNFEFTGMIVAGRCQDGNIAKLFNGRCEVNIKNQKAGRGSEIKVRVDGFVQMCGHKFELKYENAEKKIIFAQFIAADEEALSLRTLLKLFGDETFAEALPECFNISLLQVTLNYDFTDMGRKKLLIHAKFNDFDINAIFTFAEVFDFDVNIYIHGKIDFAEIPVAGMVLRSMESDTSISGFVISYSKVGGFTFGCNIWGQTFGCVIIPPEHKANDKLTIEPSSKESESTKWIPVNKNISAFMLNRLGIAFKGNRAKILVDASLNVSPLTFELTGIGIGADIPSFKSIQFVMDGFGIEFNNGAVVISGAFRHDEDGYNGEIGVTVGKLSITALGEYYNNSLMAYAILSYPIGGPPCFFVTGLAAAFGYNKKLLLPDIGNVPEYPLVAAAVGKSDKARLITELKRYITSSEGAYFLAAGVKFTSFEIVNGFAMVTVAFGRETEIGVLGTAAIVMPPQCNKTPIAKADLALKIAVIPTIGLASCEARLTAESYILSEKCRLTGEFAVYMWFGGIHKGDFVITLGGYHPSYKKPGHYPDVPRLSFRWDVLPVPNRLVISGKIYFALTPSAIMAGGKLSVVYSYGSLKAYFIAYANFLLQWKPFKYDIRIGIMLGASYRVDVWFIHHTFTIELSADLCIWGPEFSGKAHVSWFIISFTIPFGSSDREDVPPLDWKEFRDSFIVSNSGKQKLETDRKKDLPEKVPLSIRMIGETSENVVRADDLQVHIDTVIPAKSISISGIEQVVYAGKIYLQTMNGKLNYSKLEVMLTKRSCENDGEKAVNVNYSVACGNLPSALWGKKGGKAELVKDLLVGTAIMPQEYVPHLFPSEGDINEEVLTEAQKLVIYDAFLMEKAPDVQMYLHTDTIKEFVRTASAVSSKGLDLLRSLGFKKNASLTLFVKDADILFDDDILVGSVIR